MKSEQLKHLLRAIDEITGRSYEFLLIGSQAILAHIDPDWFPELEETTELFVSKEIDIAVLNGDQATQETIATQIDGTVGAMSNFETEFGYYADGVETQTATLADGWKERLKPYESDELRPNAFWALSYEDLLVSKLMAGREKDIDFVKAMHAAQPTNPGLKQVENLINSLDAKHDTLKPLALARWSAIKNAAQATAKPTKPKP